MASIEAILNDLPVVEEKKATEFRSLRINRDKQKAMFSGSTTEVKGFVKKMMQATKKYLATIDGMTKVRTSFAVIGTHGQHSLMIQYAQFWDDGTSNIYTEYVMRTRNDHFEVFGSKKSADRMAIAWAKPDSKDKKNHQEAPKKFEPKRRKRFLLAVVSIVVVIAFAAAVWKLFKPLEPVDSVERFIIQNNHIIHDKKTGLEWYAGPYEDTTWPDAKLWVAGLKVGGGGWRLPTLEELRSIYQKDISPKNLNPAFKMDKVIPWVWSGETKGPSMAWFFDFSTGSEHSNVRSISSPRAFAVRPRK